MNLYHDSRSLACRAPGGAVKAGMPIRLRLQGAYDARRVWLVFEKNGISKRMEMIPVGDGCFDLRLIPSDTPALCHYFFFIEDVSHAAVYYGAPDDDLGGVGKESAFHPKGWQITVYDPAYKTPEFMREGIMYQIFPDRFARDRMPSSQRKDIFLHENWDEPPLVKVEGEEGDRFALDFFGGTLNGIREHLTTLRELGVTVLYMNPIFKARTNHRYDTSDYEQVDPILGTNEDLAALCDAARDMGIHVILDGVFSHTGDDSKYFNKYHHFDSVGACQSKNSRYYPWYKFIKYPEDYACWWGFRTLPEIDKNNEDYREYILGKDGIVRRWLRLGTSGWRLDVADELPMSFLRTLRSAAREENPDALILGEVWEDASHKVAYGETRNYCQGDTMDSVMNYPLRTACIDFLMGKKNSESLCRVILSQQENYAPPFYYSLMNLMGSHDRARILSVLSGALLHDDERGDGNMAPLTDAQYALGVERLLDFLRIIVALPGIPCIYYGDEVGAQGAADPYCRGTYPWGHEDMQLREQFIEILALRKKRVLQTGFMETWAEGTETIVIRRFITCGHDAFGNPAEDDEYVIKITRPA